MKRSNKKKTHETFIEEMFSINPKIEILETYINAKTKIKCRCKVDNNEWYAQPTHLLSGRGCPTCANRERGFINSQRKKSHEDYVVECYNANPNLEILGEYRGCNELIKTRCKICNGIFYRNASKNHEGRGCPICAGIQVVHGINDIATTHPDFVKYFKNSEETKNYTYGSTKKTTFVCPHCKTEKIMEINKLIDYGFHCNFCDDGISYPNKFGRVLLKSLPVSNIIYEYSPKWASPYRYDNYFEYNGNSYILEMDGGFHYQKFYHSNLSLEETQQRDALKDLLAKENGIKMIRIDCRISTKDYIVNSIYKSVLNDIFCLNDIDWELCNRQATKSLVIEVCQYYNTNQSCSVKDISNVFKLTQSTISEYLYKGNELGICKYYPKNKLKVQVTYNGTKYYFDTFKKCITEMGKYLEKGSIRGLKETLKHRLLSYDNFLIEYNQFCTENT